MTETSTDEPSPQTRVPLINATVRIPAELAPAERTRLHELMTEHFAGVSPASFFQDLDEKNWVVLLADSVGQLQGFSTLAHRVLSFEDRPIAMFYSGDTVIDDRYWGSIGWLRVWLKHVIGVVEQTPAVPAYWLLLTATHRTYRFLPGFLREYWPRPDRATPSEVEQLLEAMVRTKFPDEYQRETGVVRLHKAVPVQAERAASISPTVDERRETDQFVEFFCRRNPGYLQGDFLACIAPMSRENLNAMGRRLMKPLPGES
ncbi:MAG: hypothetical protein K2Y37_26835 [Pirellulales bacterium]|nr:hypothetical protein [Pirellulales bacterium]